jgi:predicted AlkP superfamily phosphohydrolase/phosphomutase
MPKKVIIGLDGVPYSLIKVLTENGVMPNMKRIIREGIFKRMASSIPEVSSVAWSSIITGANPGEHGIYGFTDVAPGSYRLSFPNFNSLKVPPFWSPTLRPPGGMDKSSGKSVIINVPSTYPAAPLDGVLIAGFVALELNKAVYPQYLVEKLEQLDYQIDVDSNKAHQSMELFLRDLNRTLESRITAYEYLWNEVDWNTFMLVFTGTDRLNHFLWDAYEDESHRFHSDFLNHFHRIDETLGDINDRLGSSDLLIIISDHGFERLEESINVNAHLKNCGLLSFKNNPPKSLNDIEYSTVAFALDPGRIYINMKDRYPRGCVKKDEKESVIRDLTQAFESLEIGNRKVIDRIYLREEIYQGPILDRAPDLVLMPKTGFDLKASIKAVELSEKTIFTGKHTQTDAFLFVKGSFDSSIIPDEPSVFDVLKLLAEQ